MRISSIESNVKHFASVGDDLTSGFRWYDDARDQCVKFHDIVSEVFPDKVISLEHTVATIAAASANCSVMENWHRAWMWFAGQRVPLVHGNLETLECNALRFGNCNLGTPKTQPFNESLLLGDSKCGDTSVIPVIDRHICWGATVGKVLDKPSVTLHKAIVRAIHRVALKHDCPVTLVQSWCWHGVLDAKGDSDITKPFSIGDYAAEMAGSIQR